MAKDGLAVNGVNNHYKERGGGREGGSIPAVSGAGRKTKTQTHFKYFSTNIHNHSHVFALNRGVKPFLRIFLLHICCNRRYENFKMELKLRKIMSFS